MAAKKHKKTPPKGRQKNLKPNKQKTSQTNKGPKKSSNKTTESSVYIYVAAFLLALTTYYTYYGALDNDFVDWDDFAYVINNDLVRPTADIIQTPAQGPSAYSKGYGTIFKSIVSLNYHPLTILSMRWNNNVCPECINGISARPFIFWNIILHILNALLVLFFVFGLTKKNLWAAVIVATVFALHPMHVESVAWVSERKDVLYVFFFMSGLLSYTKYLQQPSSKWWLITLLFFVLSCLSKAMAVVFAPVLLLLYFWYDPAEKAIDALKNTLQPKKTLHLLPFFVLALFFGIIATNVQSGGDFNGILLKTSDSVAINKFDTFSIMQRFQFACYGFIDYMIQFFAPINLCTFYPYPDQVTYDNSNWFKWVPVLVLLIFALTIYSLKFTKSIAFGLAFYLITILLVLQFLSVGVVLKADRYTYLPYLGFAFIGVRLIQEFCPAKGQKIVYGLSLVACTLFIPKTIEQIETWQNSDSLWTNVIDLHTIDGKVLQQNMEQPLSIRGNYYGKMSEKAANPTEAMQYINKAFEDFKKAAQLGSKRAEVYEGMGNTYGRRGYQMQIEGNAEAAMEQFEQAIRNYNLALEYKTNGGSIYFNRAITYSILGQHQNAIEDYTKSIQLQPQQVQKASINRGIAYLKTKQFDLAIQDFNTGLQYNPNDINALLNRGIAWSNLGRKEKALLDIQSVLKMAPSNAEANRLMQQLSNTN